MKPNILQLYARGEEPNRRPIEPVGGDPVIPGVDAAGDVRAVAIGGLAEVHIGNELALPVHAVQCDRRIGAALHGVSKRNHSVGAGGNEATMSAHAHLSGLPGGAVVQ